MFEKILVPLDGSDLAATILPQVADLAKLFNAKVTLMTVGSSDICAKEPAPCPELPVAKFLKDAAGNLESQGVKVEWVYKQGEPAQEIILYADENRMDLIALASHGSGVIAWALGSVAKRVIDHSTVAVLLLRVSEVKVPGLKSELYYSLQTP